MPPKTNRAQNLPAPSVRLAASADPRLPAAGTAIVRPYKGRMLRVVVQPNGFDYEGQRYRSLSAVAKAITGSHCNGFRFFNLKEAK